MSQSMLKSQMLKTMAESIVGPIVTKSSITKIDKSRMETFMTDWIDSDKLYVLLKSYRIVGPGLTTIFICPFLKLPAVSPPPIIRAESMTTPEDRDDPKIQILLCKMKDSWMSIILFALSYFNHNYVIDTSGLSEEKQKDNDKLKHRLICIYRILTDLIIGGPDLSDKSIQDKFIDEETGEIRYKSAYSHIFQTDNKKSSSKSIFGSCKSSVGGSKRKTQKKKKPFRLSALSTTP